MPLATIVELLLKYGLPLTGQIMAWVKAGQTEATPEMWATIETLSNYRSADSLAAAGIAIVDGKVVPIVKP